jgi:steroid delta-isomerase-like uncharacterized protein
MATEAENLALVRRFWEDVWGGNNPQRVEEYIADDFVLHDPAHPSAKTGPQGYKEYASYYLSAVPDTTSRLDDIFASGDKVVIRWSTEGTHSGTHLHGYAPSHKRATVQGISIYRVADGKIVEYWNVTDNHGALHQFGHIPKPGA